MALILSGELTTKTHSFKLFFGGFAHWDWRFQHYQY